MSTKFQHYPSEPNSDHCQDAYFILCSAHDAATSFLDIFSSIRKARKAKGASTDEEQDLLRAMLIFATAGLDSMVKQLIRDALPEVIRTEAGATEMLKQYIERRLHVEGQINRRFLADVLGDVNPRNKLMASLITSLTGESLQSMDQLLRVAAHFDIPSRLICENPALLKTIFNVRNEINHEMDIDFAQTNRSRRPRSKNTMVAHTNEIFRIAASFLTQVDGKIAQR